MVNAFERAHELNPEDPADAATDSDNDGYTNLEENQLDTNPRVVNADRKPPTMPVFLDPHSTPISSLLRWTESVDFSDILQYRLYRDGVEISTGKKQHWTDAPLEPSRTYRYEVAAEDIKNNLSHRSEIYVTTPASTELPPGWQAIDIGGAEPSRAGDHSSRRMIGNSSPS